MAVKIDIETSACGIPFPGAYVRIIHAITGRQSSGAHKHMVAIDALAYATDSPPTEAQSVATYRYEVPLEDIEAQAGDAFLARCYAWLMQQDGFEGGVAV